MPLTVKGKKIKEALVKEYGTKKGTGILTILHSYSGMMSGDTGVLA